MSKGLKYIDSSAKALLRTVKDEINKWVRGQIEKNVRGLMRKHAPVFLKKKLKDPAMCDCVKKTVDDIVDAIWPEIETEIMMKLNYALYPIEEYPLEEVENGWLLCLCVKIRAWYRYTSDPVDKTIWNQIRWFSWWVLTITKMIPFYFVQPGFFILHFFLMDMTDEFQCIAYILKFKGLQFLSAGVIKGLIGFTQYYICVNYQDPKNGEHNCHNSGPGSSTNVLVELLSFLFMIAFVWLAALVMLCSKTKGAARFQYQDTSAEKPKNGCCCCFHPANVKYYIYIPNTQIIYRGGRIWCFMMFDAVVFLMCAIAFLIVARFLSVKDKEWQLQADIYFCQFAYGILSFPFNLFAVAFFKTLVIKCRPTGYDKCSLSIYIYIYTVYYNNYVDWADVFPNM